MMKSGSCPNCKKKVLEDAKAWPFCCPKCRDADLLGWLNEEYKVSRELNEDEFDAFISQQTGALNPYDPDNF